MFRFYPSLAGNEDNNPCASTNYQGYSVAVVHTNCTTDQGGDSYRYLSATPTTAIFVPVAPIDSVYSVSVLFSGLRCTGTVVNSTIALQNAASKLLSSQSYYYFEPQSKKITCTAPANGTCSGYNYNACPTEGLTFATVPPVAPFVPSWNKIEFRNNVCRGGKQGGTVFIVKDPQTTTELFGPQIPYYNERVVFDNNTAGAGKGVATQTTTLRSTSNHTTIFVNDYNVFLRPSLVFTLVDAYNNINTTDFTTTVSYFYLTALYPALFQSNVVNHHCPCYFRS